ncbi:ABC transporter substrate-binding protein [Agaricicola taiwanensis]|uniref:ABC transporter substrate-binding protein n=1 Tax=Agaricicola taiwanensis TaxID=591372 RepID=A0A8J3DU41_9RHOB|nr:ABC transporter substrate-binding protein [Agaricicola taiwanensis]GGE42693.1 ABC transporter substrate-binding protein [Agaricicola taiwanensis]
MKLLNILGLATAASLAFGSAALAQVEKPDVSLGVGGKSLLYYLPLTIAEQKGFFKEEGLNVTINDFRGGSQSLQALVGGSVDVVTGAYEHTIRMQTKGQDIRAVLELGRFPGIVLAVGKEKADKVKSIGDLKGMKIGVTAPGSSTAMFATYLLAKEGVKPEEVAFIGVGGGATGVAAMQRGEIDAISNLDPVISTLARDNLITILADTRTEEGTKKIFGGNNPAAVLYTKQEFIENNPKTVQALVNGLYKALKWLDTATPEDVADTVPAQYHLNDRTLYLEAVKNSLPTYSRTGVITEEGQKAAMELLSYDPEMAKATVDVSKTFDGQFVKKAAGN